MFPAAVSSLLMTVVCLHVSSGELKSCPSWEQPAPVLVAPIAQHSFSSREMMKSSVEKKNILEGLYSPNVSGSLKSFVGATWRSGLWKRHCGSDVATWALHSWSNLFLLSPLNEFHCLNAMNVFLNCLFLMFTWINLFFYAVHKINLHFNCNLYWRKIMLCLINK